MHQNPRIPARRSPVVPETQPRPGSPIVRPQTPSDNSDDNATDGRTRRSTRQPGGYPQSPQARSPTQPTSRADQEERDKLNKIVQHFYTQAAQLIIQNRSAVARSSKNRPPVQWFGIMIEPTDEYSTEIHPWAVADAFDPPPEPMIIESYLDLSDLRSDQRLFLVDDDGKRWNAADGLQAGREPGDLRLRPPRAKVVVLERWRVALGSPPAAGTNLRQVLPSVYKQCIPLFRSLFTYMKLLPASKLVQRLIRTRNQRNSIRPRIRFVTDTQIQMNSMTDALYAPLLADETKVVERFSFDGVPTPAGPLLIDVSYRACGNFVIDEVESLLSSRLANLDEDFFNPRSPVDYPAKPTEPGSLPDQVGKPVRRPDYSQAYGSLATFHQMGPVPGSSPLSALRALRDPSAGSYSPVGMTRPSSDGRSAPARPVRPVSLLAGGGRRPSLSFQPFNAPTLNEATLPRETGSSDVSYYSVTSRPGDEGSRPQSRKERATSDDYAVASGEGTSSVATSREPIRPSPGPRFSSSFANRRARLSAGNADELESRVSGSRVSQLSSSPGQQDGRPGSRGGRQHGSSSSARTEDDEINNFIKMLEGRKENDGPSQSQQRSEASKRIGGAHVRYNHMKDTGKHLSESMSVSTAHHRSSSTSSRQLSSVPPMIGPTSLSTASSPGKPASPHTPHTPAIPSRLSATSMAADYPEASRSRMSTVERGRQHESEQALLEEDDEPVHSGTAPRDIPTSPHRPRSHARRPSSLEQQRLAFGMEDLGDFGEYGLRRASVGEDRGVLSLSALLALQATPDHALNDPAQQVSIAGEERAIGPELARRHQVAFSLDSGDNSPRQRTGSNASSAFRPRLGNRRSRGSLGSIGAADRGSVSVQGERPGSGPASGRNSVSRGAEEDDQLLFDMSEVDARGRRSVDEARDGRRGSRGRGATDRRPA